MVRSWWPDAASGETQAGLKLTASHVDSLAKAGVGGMEIAFLSDRLTGIPASSTLPASQQLGQPGVDQSTVQTSAGQCCVAYTNAQAQTLGFGSANWQKVLTQIFKTANGDNMHVDLTLSQHWPVAFNDVDPNDPGAQQQAATAYSVITSADEAAGSKQLPLPALRLQDPDNVPFIFVSHYAAATIMKVASVSASGVPTFSYASLTDASPQTSQIKGAGYAAGIPDAAWVQANQNAFTGDLTAGSTTVSNVSAIAGATKQAGSLLTGPGIPAGTYIVSVGANSLVMSNAATATTSAAAVQAEWNINTINADWGPVPTGNFQGKIDAQGDRRRMADWQDEYQTAISSATLSRLGCTIPAAGAALAAGDCVLYGTYYQGTGQTRSGGVNEMEYNREYVTNIYSQAGTSAIENFWDNYILGTWSGNSVTKPLGDSQLIGLIKDNAAANPEDAVFEDSFELSKTGSGNYWTPDLLSEMSGSLGYDAAQYAPLLAGGASFDTSSASGELPSTRVSQDMTASLGQDFTNDHVVALQDWAKRTLGYNFKVQAEGGAPGITGAEPLAGIQEGDNGATDDAWRNLQGAANLNGTNLVSDEALTFGTDYTTAWEADVKGLNLDWAGGANRVNMHGTPFNETANQLPAETTINGVASEWPGWEFQHGSANGYGVFDARQAYWSDMYQLTGYIGRTQSVLQGGVAKPDIAVLEGSSNSYSLPRTNSLQTLLDAGWTYNVLDEQMLTLPNAKVTNGVLDEYGPTNGLHEGPAYKAIVVSGATTLSTAAIEKLVSYAKAGLPVIFFNSDITQVFGTNQPGGNSTSLTGNNDTALAADLSALMSMPNVYTVSSTDQSSLISQLGQLGITPAASYAAPGLETVHREIDGRNYYYLYNSATTGSNLTASVTLAGGGQPYQLNAWTGQVTPIADYTSSNGTVTVSVSLAPQEATIIGTGTPAQASLHATASSGGTVEYGRHGNGLVLQATQAGSYTVSLSDGTTADVTVSSVPAAADLSQGWSLKLDSWGPDPTADAVNPEISTVTTTTFPANALGAWSSLPATSAQLSALGATSMSQVSGVGYYSNTLQLPSTWTPGSDGAYLQLAHGNGDMIVGVTVNGHDAGPVSQITSTVDIGRYLQPGSNTIQVKVDTNLGNKVGRATQSYGLTGVTFEPYATVPASQRPSRVR
jgi:hypothetical protein